jgi:2-methylisocitrate lyase-like PEP mutase family enzyme
MNHAAQNLRDLLAGPDVLIQPVVHDALSTRLTAQAGFPVALLGGLPVAAVQYGLPDVGYIGRAEIVETMRNISAAVPGYPIIADGDTGYGNAMSVRHTVREYARAGAACILIEDHVWPKKCGHYLGGRPVIPRDEARMKIRAAVEAAKEADILVLARTDARGSMGFEESLARLRMFEEEGAHILFAEALESVEEMRAVGGGFATPTVASMMPKTPVAARADLAAMGFKIIAYNVLLGAAIKAMQDTLAALKADKADNAPPRITMDQIAELAGLPEYNKLEGRYAAG